MARNRFDEISKAEMKSYLSALREQARRGDPKAIVALHEISMKNEASKRKNNGVKFIYG